MRRVGYIEIEGKEVDLVVEVMLYSSVCLGETEENYHPGFWEIHVGNIFSVSFY